MAHARAGPAQPPHPPRAHGCMQEPEVTFPICDQYGNEDVLRARSYHPFSDAVKRLVEKESQATGQQQLLEVDLYR